ncbi:50S ribosomal protein L11 methyltransferase [Afifella sp. IM 167]|uniref:50S ribosomal protein L11 methyltransferase n=1 Tax=Afifella sp. IM 167 TaxID=2033586 RepID=UPI001CCCF9AD|nr:50S ribosomal protein L11 methyltransferase [Afifella sp. IM 167]MBZ8135209.1 50S ribosomal protein L11 methyltransferase [Afifella sp. IM 167]
MSWRASRLGTRAESEELTDRLEAELAEEGAVISLFEAGEQWRLDVYHEGGEAALKADLAAALGAIAGEFSYAELPEADWVGESLKGLAPVPAGRFLVHGAHDRQRLPAGRIAIEIDAGQAFGTGHHATTLGCLTVLDELSKRWQFERMLDLGTGTGLLAIALAKLTRRPVLASDIDPLAVRIAGENAALNGAGHLVTTIVANGLRHPKIAAGAPYDLVVANILAGPLIALAPSVKRVVAPGGTAVLSGILAHQASRVTAAWRGQGFALQAARRFGEWSVLVLSRRD